MRITALVLSAALFASPPAAADDEYVPPVNDPLLKKECGECHLTFHPVLLPAASWRKIMATLADHFGEDASLDAETRDKIEIYLIAKSQNRRVDPDNPPLRFTNFYWFREEHNEDEVASMIIDRNIKTWADCISCHRNAERGYYD